MRIQCYDFSGYKIERSRPNTQADTGRQWSYTEEKSSLDGRADVWLSLDSNNTQPNQIDRFEKARLWVRCMENSTNIFVTFNDYTSENQNVRYKVDDGSVRKVWMVHMRGGDGIGIWSKKTLSLLSKGYLGIVKW